MQKVTEKICLVSKLISFLCFCYIVLLTSLKICLSLSKSLFEVVKGP